MDLAVAQAGDRARLFRNQSARPGIRVILQGTPDNRQAIGAWLRVKSGASWGPVHEIRAGSGYGSLDSAVQILARPEGPASLQVRWPGGRTMQTEIPWNADVMILHEDN
jgi:hypothetical protein